MLDLDSDGQARLAYLVLLLLVIGGSIIFSGHRQLNRSLQHLGIWGLIFVGAVAAYGLRDQLSLTLRSSAPAIQSQPGQVTLGRAYDGHFYATLRIDGVDVDFAVDTGATGIVLSRRDAERIGLDVDKLRYFGNAQTANGPVQTAPVRLNRTELGPFVDTNLLAEVNGGALDISLLGMRYLSLFSHIEIKENQMVLSRD
ncbi:MAG: TIGR02281 family clan AA aspartic protease [Paracoccaceae bacterium]